MKEMLLPYFDERPLSSPLNKGETPLSSPLNKGEHPLSSPLNKGGIKGGCAINMLVFHSTIFDIDKFVYYSHQYKNSAHYHMDLNGNITKLVPEDKSAWHAGKGFWRGFDGSINSRSIGIEIQNKTLGQTPFQKKQIEKLIPFVKKIIKKYDIKPEMIVGHSDIAPTRKPDPGHRFPWKELSKHDIGFWYRLNQKSKKQNPKLLLETIGYDTNNLNAAAYAFCRRFLPEFVEKDNNIQHLVDNVLPKNFDFTKQEKFLKTLQAVAYSYNVSSS